MNYNYDGMESVTPNTVAKTFYLADGDVRIVMPQVEKAIDEMVHDGLVIKGSFKSDSMLVLYFDEP